jgi:recombinational DNA repair protein (RecF pathway)
VLTRGELLAFPRPGEGLWIFKEWNEHARPKLGQSYRMLAAASYFCEFLEVLTRPLAQTGGSVHIEGATGSSPFDDGSSSNSDEYSAKSRRLFELLEVSVTLLEKKIIHPGLLALGFTLRALECEGLLPPLDGCQICGKKFPPALPRGFGVRFGNQGYTCAACAKTALDANARSVLLGSEAINTLALCARKGVLSTQHSALSTAVKPFSARTGEQLALALELLVHGALEQNLRTLEYAKKLLKVAGGANVARGETRPTR